MQKAPEAARTQFKSIIPWDEFGTSEEIATAAWFLACDDSKFVSGTELCVDGGTAQIQRANYFDGLEPTKPLGP
jgi:NAD(P)-dependent dehydrogenase (short-subunit alcohol dehydrogenase family)